MYLNHISLAAQSHFTHSQLYLLYFQNSNHTLQASQLLFTNIFLKCRRYSLDARLDFWP